MDFKFTDEVNDAKAKLVNSTTLIKESEVLVDKIVSALESDAWSGEGKKSFQNVMLLCQQLHKKLSDAAEDNGEEIEKMITNVETFMSTNMIIKRLGE